MVMCLYTSRFRFALLPRIKRNLAPLPSREPLIRLRRVLKRNYPLHARTRLRTRTHTKHIHPPPQQIHRKWEHCADGAPSEVRADVLVIKHAAREGDGRGLVHTCTDECAEGA